jgi:hypothetical protein
VQELLNKKKTLIFSFKKIVSNSRCRGWYTIKYFSLVSLINVNWIVK